jgi:membrane protein YqaA with SNARE-associated domain
VTLLLTFLVSAASALVPLVNTEGYLLGANSAVQDAWWLLALAAAAGQTLGKLMLFLAARGAIRVSWLNRRRHRSGPSAGRVTRGLTAVRATRGVSWLNRRKLSSGPSDGWAVRWMTAVRTNRSGPAALVGTSALLGLPPLLATSALAGTTTMRPSLFAAICLSGRWARFCLVLAAPALVLG